MENHAIQRGRRAVPADRLLVLDAETGALLGELGDVGLGGARVRGARYLPPGMHLEVSIELPRDAHHAGPIVARAEVAWCRPEAGGSGHELGLAFAELRRDAEAALAELFYRRSA